MPTDQFCCGLNLVKAVTQNVSFLSCHDNESFTYMLKALNEIKWKNLSLKNCFLATVHFFHHFKGFTGSKDSFVTILVSFWWLRQFLRLGPSMYIRETTFNITGNLLKQVVLGWVLVYHYSYKGGMPTMCRRTIFIRFAVS